MSPSGAATDSFPVRVFGGPTARFDYGGLGFLTDPTFDSPGDYPVPGGLVLSKVAPSDGGPTGLGRLDVVLLSHDQHPDNLDHAGRALLADAPSPSPPPAAADVSVRWPEALPTGSPSSCNARAAAPSS